MHALRSYDMAGGWVLTSAAAHLALFTPQHPPPPPP